MKWFFKQLFGAYIRKSVYTAMDDERRIRKQQEKEKLKQKQLSNKNVNSNDIYSFLADNFDDHIYNYCILYIKKIYFDNSESSFINGESDTILSEYLLFWLQKFDCSKTYGMKKYSKRLINDIKSSNFYNIDTENKELSEKDINNIKEIKEKIFEWIDYYKKNGIDIDLREITIDILKKIINYSFYSKEIKTKILVIYDGLFIGLKDICENKHKINNQ